MAIYHGPVPPAGSGSTGTFKPINWDRIVVPVDSIGGSISAGTINYNYDVLGELLDFQMKHDLDYIRASGMSEEDLNNQERTCYQVGSEDDGRWTYHVHQAGGPRGQLCSLQGIHVGW